MNAKYFCFIISLFLFLGGCSNPVPQEDTSSFDEDSAQKIDCLFVKDKNNVYSTHTVSPNAITPEMCDDCYSATKEEVKRGYGIDQSLNADPKTFEVFFENEYSCYSRDKKSVFYSEKTGYRQKTNRIEEADPKTFSASKGFFGVDNTRAYYKSTAIEKSDPTTFKRVLEKIPFFTDKNHSYFMSTILPEVDPKTLKVVSTELGWETPIYFSDDQNAYCLLTTEDYNGVKIKSYQLLKGADPKTLSLIWTNLVYVGESHSYVPDTFSRYVKDNAHVFHDCDEVDGAYPETFNPSNWEKDRAYREEKAKAKAKAIAIDPSLIETPQKYLIEKDHVYKNKKILEKADSATFTVLEKGFTKDKNFVYKDDEIIPDADPKSFVVLSTIFSKDKNYVYKYRERFSGSDAESFVVLDDAFSKDKNHVYHYFVALSEIDPESFVLFNKRFEKDKNHIYFLGEIMPNLDPESFEILEYDFIKDKDSVYYSSWFPKKVDGADPKSFVVIDQNFSKDKKHVYHSMRILEVADAATFQEVDQNTKEYNIGEYKDKKHFYDYMGMVLQ